MSTPTELNKAQERIRELESELRLARVDEAFHKLTVAQRDGAWHESEVMRAALELIATPKRADGTYNRSREACEELARETLQRLSKLLSPT